MKFKNSPFMYSFKLITVVSLIVLSICSNDKNQEPLPYNNSLQKLLNKNNNNLLADVSNFFIKFERIHGDTSWFIRINPCIDISAKNNCVFFRNPVSCQKSETFPAIMGHFFPKPLRKDTLEFPSGGDGVSFSDSVYSFISTDSATADSIVFIINEIKKLSSFIPRPSPFQNWINGIFDNFGITILSLFLFYGPLVPTIVILFFKRFRENKLTRWVFISQWLLYFGFLWNAYSARSSFGLILISILILIFDLIYIPVKYMTLKKETDMAASRKETI